MKLTMTVNAETKPVSCRLKSSWQPVSKSRTAIGSESGRAMYNVLVVDDDANLTRLMATILRTSGIEPLTATDGYAALDAVEHNVVDAIVLDIEMPRMDGRGFFHELRARGIETPVLIASAYGAHEAQRELGA